MLNFSISKKDFKSIVGNYTFLYIDKQSIREEAGVPFTNYRMTNEYSSGRALILDNKDYAVLERSLRAASVKRLHLINVKNGDRVFEVLINYLRNVNGLDHSYWNESNLWGKTSYDKRGTIEAYRPVYKEELIKSQLDSNAMVLFTMVFIGLLFVIANGVVLYYKVLSDIDAEEERLKSLTRIGVSEKEIKSMISKEMAITFFVPILFGGGIGLYYLYVMFSNSEMVELFMKKVFVILLWGATLQILFYIISRKKYIKEAMQKRV